MPKKFEDRMYAALDEMKKDPDMAFRVMVDAGIYTDAGELTEHYRQS